MAPASWPADIVANSKDSNPQKLEEYSRYQYRTAVHEMDGSRLEVEEYLGWACALHAAPDQVRRRRRRPAAARAAAARAAAAASPLCHAR